MIGGAIGAVVAALIAAGVKLWLGRRAPTAADQRAVDAGAIVQETTDAQAIAENVHRLSDDELNRRLRADGAGR